ncbi:copper homeostasis protein CutC [Heyndrickxia oleronia]|uniref:copper homeostasis protein CutC n=1 Tax=Heyndrickxia oleronia TaxID=38875 RepID=UPI003F876553
MIIEVIADNVEDAIIAEQAGANRIELITGVAEGGLTPSYGIIEAVCKAVSIPVYVMIRPHSRSFCYSNTELNSMVKDIQICKELGAAGVVWGVLNKDGDIDKEALKKLLDASNGLDITFHRAFDEVNDQLEALNVIQQYPEISRILTSGGKDKAIDATSELQQLVNKCEGTSLKIMAGSGLTPNNIGYLLEQVKVTEIHFGSGVHHQSSFSYPIDPQKIQEIKNLL